METVNLRIAQNGRISIPKEMRQLLGLEDGDEVMVSVEGKRLVIESEAALLERLYETVGSLAESELASKALLAERRSEGE